MGCRLDHSVEATWPLSPCSTGGGVARTGTVSPASISTAALKSQPSRNITKAMTSPPAPQPLHPKYCLRVSTKKRRLPWHDGHGPTSWWPSRLSPSGAALAMSRARARSTSACQEADLPLLVGGEPLPLLLPAASGPTGAAVSSRTDISHIRRIHVHLHCRYANRGGADPTPLE